MKHYLLFAALCSMTALAQAGVKADQKVTFSPNIDRNLFNVYEDNGKSTHFFRKSTPQHAKSNETVKVTLTYEDEDWMYYPLFGFALNGSTVEGEYMGSGDATFELEKGVYDFCCQFRDDETFSYFSYVFKEQVEVTNDTVIVFDPYEANIKLSIECVGPNGKWTLPTYNEDYDLVDLGNSVYCSSSTLISCKGIGVVTGTFNGQDYDDPYTPIEASSVIFVNEVSDRYMFLQSRQYLDKDGVAYANTFKFNGISVRELRNDPAKYFPITSNFEVQKTRTNETCYATLDTKEILNGRIEGGTIGFNTVYPLPDGCKEITVYVDAPYEEGENAYNLYVAPAICNKVTLGEENYLIDKIIARPAIVKDGQVTYLYDCYEDLNTTNFIPNDTYAWIKEEEGHPLLNIQADDMQQVWGASSPLLVFLMQDFAEIYQGQKVFNWSSNFMNLNGAAFEPAKSALEVELYGDGSLVENMGTWSTYPNRWKNAGRPIHDFELHMTAGNACVDDMEGKASLVVKFDTDRDDYTAPTLVAMQIRENATVTNKLTNTDNAKLYLVAADFQNHYYNFDAAFETLKPASLSVSYAVHGSNDWAELNSKELPEYAFYNYGFTYEASLAEIETTQADQWFDVKVVIIDEAGNSQEQILSPAFKVEEDNTTSIKTFDTEALYNVYNVQGQLVATGVKASSLNLVQGTYFLQSIVDGANTKMIVK